MRFPWRSGPFRREIAPARLAHESIVAAAISFRNLRSAGSISFAASSAAWLEEAIQPTSGVAAAAAAQRHGLEKRTSGNL